TQEAGIVLPDGKGLGIVAGDFAGEGRVSLFIANDTTPNFYLVNQAAPGERPQFADRALIAGLGLNEEGRTEACMGVAAGDADGDGRLDLFITNFESDSNTLYRNTDGRLFLDATRDARLREPSLPMLGFGTQFLDADLDGRLDLVVANGHIDNFGAGAAAYQMPPQFFHNLGAGRFAEAKAETLGSYFQGRYLGRGLARCDWNGDGREDVVISHLDAPAALVTNRTTPAGNSLSIRLSGVTSARDAIGAVVRAKAGDAVLVRQLTAGDGYQASNQRTLHFGLGDRDRVDELTIHWPSGQIDTAEGLEAGRGYLFIEGRPGPAANVGHSLRE
ncbi:MAG: CRTAC1 family protein, partial [Planctomycetes bacterium]|nr:CRTAC1 family protein [Planctomycetota bacterium]